MRRGGWEGWGVKAGQSEAGWCCTAANLNMWLSSEAKQVLVEKKKKKPTKTYP